MPQPKLRMRFDIVLNLTFSGTFVAIPVEEMVEAIFFNPHARLGESGRTLHLCE
jgi:hypothetical protein